MLTLYSILDESIFCPMEKLTKKFFVEKWKTLTNEVRFSMVSEKINFLGKSIHK
jgi:hypothetical protein